MEKFKNIIKSIKISKITTFCLSVLLVLITVSYLSFLFLLPKVLNSPKMVSKYESFLSQKLGNQVFIRSFNFKSKPDLSVEISVGNIYTKDKKDSDIINIKDVDIASKPMSLKLKNLNVESAYVDFEILKKYLKTGEKTSENKFDINYLPLMNIKKIYIKIDKTSNIELSNIKSQKNKGKIVCTFLGKVTIPYVKTPVILGQEGSISYLRDLNFDNFSLQLENSKIFLTGALNNLNIQAKDLPAEELKASFLYFYKLKHPHKKNFIENFEQFSGTLDVNLNYTKDGLAGACTAHKISALFSKFKIPVTLPEVVFKFSKHNISTAANGLFGSEPVHTDFYLSGLFTDSIDVQGTVQSTLTGKFARRYFPIVKISGNAEALVKYHTKNKIVNIDYILTIPKGSNLLSKFGDLNSVDKTRQISAETIKKGDKIYLRKYKYMMPDDKDFKILLSGSGLFEKIKGSYNLSSLSLKTNGKVPVALIQSFTKNFLRNGYFSSDLKYISTDKSIYGWLELYDVSHEDYLFLEKTKLSIDGSNLKLDSNGTFFNSPITLSVNADNNFKNNILIHDIDIHLNKFVVKRGEYSSLSDNIPKSSGKKATDSNIIVEKGTIKVDEIVHSKFYLHDVEILGSLKNNIVDFVIPQTDYANGILSAKGLYNLKNHSSDIQFFASDINSNEVVTKIFNLPNQVQGDAFATLHLKTKNKLNDIKAHATFAIADGFLPKIGSTEFMVKKSKKMRNFKFINFDKIKFTLSKITNIDFTNKEVLTSNLNGSFDLDNDEVNNVNIFSQSDYISLFIEGKYHIDSQFAYLYIWGRHNKTAEKKIRILKLPFSFLYKLIFRAEHSKDFYQDKLSKIPPIKLKPGDIESVFRVFVNGNLDSNNLQVRMKDLR